MKRATLVIASLAALSLSGCAGLAAYFSPMLQADQAAVSADVVVVNNDLLQAKADYADNQAALPADAAKLVVDQAVLRAAFTQWTADLKAAGRPAPPAPAAPMGA